MASMAGGLAKEIRYALRSFRKRPAFTFVAGATIALGVGANTTILSVVNGVLLQPLTYPGSEGLITVVAPWTASQGELGTMSYPGPVD